MPEAASLSLIITAMKVVLLVDFTLVEYKLDVCMLCEHLLNITCMFILQDWHLRPLYAPLLYWAFIYTFLKNVFLAYVLVWIYLSALSRPLGSNQHFLNPVVLQLTGHFSGRCVIVSKLSFLSVKCQEIRSPERGR